MRNKNDGGAAWGDDVSIKSALVSAGGSRGQTAELVEINDLFAIVKLHFSPPKLSESGHSYVCGFGSVGQGALKVNIMAYIPIPKKDRRDANGAR